MARFLSRKHHYLSLLVVSSSSSLSFSQLLQLHAQIQVSGLHRDEFLTSELLRFLSLSFSSSSNSLSYAHFLLSHSSNPTRSSYNHLIRGHVKGGSFAECIDLFHQMRRLGLRPNELTFPFVLKSCAHMEAIRLGVQVHADVFKSGVDSVVFVGNTLMLVYGSCGCMKEVRKLFGEMPVRTVVSWNTILTACVENTLLEESIGMFIQMMGSGFEPDQTTFVVLFSAAAEIGSLRLGKWAHGQLVGIGLVISLQLGTALVNMYAKCGAIRYARHVFDMMPVRNVWTWSAMILGLAQHGFAKDALQLFSQMKDSLIEPNYITYLGVLCACSHAGLVDDARRFFHEMEHDHGIKPAMSHYSAMVDVLGRGGCLQEAYDFIKSMVIEPDAVVWRTLLSACQLHSSQDSVDIGEDVKKRLLALEPNRSGNYVIIANMYSEVGSWKEAAEVRRMMREEGLKKVAGESCVEVGGWVRRFISGDDSCIGYESIKGTLDGLNMNMKKIESIDMNYDFS
ncbi:pentatricopeptide repeat-containing protein At2g36730 [Typha latifolia]|uniref:pentatricopeptide repeat-containing protein At2g36730 n=1 Tax=Typha latifolia TaxID=4733 RepID=UPI003C30AEEE